MPGRTDTYASLRWGRLHRLAETLADNFPPDHLRTLAENVDSIASQTANADEWAVLRAAFTVAVGGKPDASATTRAMRQMDADTDLCQSIKEFERETR